MGLRGAAELRCYMNLMALEELPETSTGPHRGAFRERLEAIRAAGYDGVQFAKPGSPKQLTDCRALGLGMAASGRVNLPAEAAPLAERFAGDGYDCAPLHVGWGIEDDDQAAHLIDGVLKASQRWGIPLYVETHRATIFQDMWRTVGFVRRFPELQINGDFSHWYTGQEMVYGGFEKKLAFIAPVIERVRFLHGRIGNPGCIQVSIDASAPDEPLYVRHFKQLWTACFRNVHQNTQPGDRIYFTPELLGPSIYYARTFLNSQGLPVEESDRWQQSLILKRIAEQCFEAACGA